jgi:nitric oxide reductase activation protein
MADGIQFGLDALNERTEGHRVLFCITDGCPNGGHEAIMRRQLRIAKEAGIHVIGVGVGYGAQYVTNVFPDSVYAADVKQLPVLLIAKLNDLIDARTSKRGRKMKVSA